MKVKQDKRVGGVNNQNEFQFFEIYTNLLYFTCIVLGSYRFLVNIHRKAMPYHTYFEVKMGKVEKELNMVKMKY